MAKPTSGPLTICMPMVPVVARDSMPLLCCLKMSFSDTFSPAFGCDDGRVRIAKSFGPPEAVSMYKLSQWHRCVNAICGFAPAPRPEDLVKCCSILLKNKLFFNYLTYFIKRIENPGGVKNPYRATPAKGGRLRRDAASSSRFPHAGCGGRGPGASPAPAHNRRTASGHRGPE